MESHQSSMTSTVGFSLLPSELLHHIILDLALPDIVRLKFTNKFITSVISDQDFVREYNLRANSATWLFLYKKRWHRDSALHGFTDSSDRWFRFSIAELLNSVVPPGEDIYFLTSSGNHFLFALNTSQEVVCVNLMTKTVKRIPSSPLGPRGTSSWRRSRAREKAGDSPSFDGGVADLIFLSVVNGRGGSVLIGFGSQAHNPVVLRPRFNGGVEEDSPAVGFSWGNLADRLHVYGDGHVMMIRSCGGGGKARMLKSVELWALSPNGGSWEPISAVPNGLIEKIRKPYGVIMGCLERREGTIRAVLMSNYEASWDIIWLSYDTSRKHWTWVPLPDCKMKGSNMAGIGFSSGLILP
ncbi:uncharacterized protein LOC127807012 [Diospyros lotus]|uniref:uncharacterized protein LOC127807012 n=1 Tax=Diospyros lotus TaxID=55363 RepID=UPI00225839A3|nr:uncharacterized protein LOC127807012 [Diospyros lotus]